MDPCKNCVVRGDLDRCIATECSIHTSWLVQELCRMVESMGGDLEALLLEKLAKIEELKETDSRWKEWEGGEWPQ